MRLPTSWRARFLSAVRALAASCSLSPLCTPPRPVPSRYGAHQGDEKGKEIEARVRGKGRKQMVTQPVPLILSCGCRGARSGSGQWWLTLGARIRGFHPLLPFPILQLHSQHLAHHTLVSRYSPPNICGREEVQHRLSARRSRFLNRLFHFPEPGLLRLRLASWTHPMSAGLRRCTPASFLSIARSSEHHRLDRLHVILSRV